MYTVVHFVADSDRLGLAEIKSMLESALSRHAEQGGSSLVIPRPSGDSNMASIALDGRKFHDDCVLALRQLEQTSKSRDTLRPVQSYTRWGLRSALIDLLFWCDRLAPHVVAASLPKKLNNFEKLIWDALDGRALNERELHGRFFGAASRPTGSIRKAISRMKKEGWKVERCSSRGYYRPDGPPPGL